MTSMIKTSAGLALAGAFATALTLVSAPQPAAAADMEKCYGIALKGQNDCAAGSHSCSGHSTVDYDGASWKLVKKGTCTTMKTPTGTGSLEPIKS